MTMTRTKTIAAKAATVSNQQTGNEFFLGDANKLRNINRITQKGQGFLLFFIESQRQCLGMPQFLEAGTRTSNRVRRTHWSIRCRIVRVFVSGQNRLKHVQTMCRKS